MVWSHERKVKPNANLETLKLNWKHSNTKTKIFFDLFWFWFLVSLKALGSRVPLSRSNFFHFNAVVGRNLADK